MWRNKYEGCNARNNPKTDAVAPTTIRRSVNPTCQAGTSGGWAVPPAAPAPFTARPNPPSTNTPTAPQNISCGMNWSRLTQSSIASRHVPSIGSAPANSKANTKAIGTASTTPRTAATERPPRIAVADSADQRPASIIVNTAASGGAKTICATPTRSPRTPPATRTATANSVTTDRKMKN